MHAAGGSKVREEQAPHGSRRSTLMAYVSGERSGSNRFRTGKANSSLAAMVVGPIFLRQRSWQSRNR